MKRLHWLVILMATTLLIITGFQVYWLYSNYQREAATLRVKTNSLFKQTVEEVSTAHIKFDTITTNRLKKLFTNNSNVNYQDKKPQIRTTEKASKQAMVRLTTTIANRINNDSSLRGDKKNTIVISFKSKDGVRLDDSLGLPAINLDKIDPSLIKSIVIVNGKNRMTDSSNAPKKFEMLQTFMTKRLRERGFVSDSNKSKAPYISNTGSLVSSNNIPKVGQSKKRVSLDEVRPKIQTDFVYRITTIADSLPVKELSNKFKKLIDQKQLPVPFAINKINSKPGNTTEKDNEVTIGFDNPVTYQLNLGNAFPYLIKRISIPILFSVFLVSVTLLSFTAFYKNSIKQQKLAEIKNDFISNITHELKTPIATVSVAIEALRNFNALDDQERTKEYLDISEGELNRLSLLVDKVLKFSMFEQNKTDLQNDTVDLEKLVKEVVLSLKVQLDKANATIIVNADGNTVIKGDAMHLQSVVFNLLDNAIKYNDKTPLVQVNILGTSEQLTLSVKDNGPGIAKEYSSKVFEKFFRIPSGNRHNVKGYGLGLSYVAYVVKQHKGAIHLESDEGNGSTFIITLPQASTGSIS